MSGGTGGHERRKVVNLASMASCDVAIWWRYGPETSAMATRCLPKPSCCSTHPFSANDHSHKIEPTREFD